MDQRILKHLRTFYKKGTRIELERMDDVQAPPVGTRGTVRGVDDIGNYGVLGQWEFLVPYLW